MPRARKGVEPPQFKEARERKQAAEEAAAALIDEESPMDGDLTSIMAALRGLQDNRNAEHAAGLLMRELSRLSDTELAQVVKRSDVQLLMERLRGVGPLKPGTDVRDEKGRVVAVIPWRYEDLEQYENITFIPGDTMAPFWWNDLEFRVFKGIKTSLPAPVYEHYNNVLATRAVADSGDLVWEWLKSIAGKNPVTGQPMATRTVGWKSEA